MDIKDFKEYMKKWDWRTPFIFMLGTLFFCFMLLFGDTMVAHASYTNSPDGEIARNYYSYITRRLIEDNNITGTYIVTAIGGIPHPASSTVDVRVYVFDTSSSVYASDNKSTIRSSGGNVLRYAFSIGTGSDDPCDLDNTNFSRTPTVYDGTSRVLDICSSNILYQSSVDISTNSGELVFQRPQVELGEVVLEQQSLATQTMTASMTEYLAFLVPLAIGFLICLLLVVILPKVLYKFL